LSLAISLIKAMISSATLGLRETALDLRFQNRRKSSRCQPPKGVWLHDQEGLLPGPNQPGQQDEEHAIGPADGWSFHLPFEENELLAQEGIFRDQFGLASAKICHGLQRQGGCERFGPTSKTRRECMPAAILQPPEMGQNTSHTRNFSLT
jgi:hypothetical protein